MGLLHIMRAEGDPRRVITVVGSRFYTGLVLAAAVLASLAAQPSSGNEEGAAAWRDLPAWSLQSLEYGFVAHATSGMLSLTVREPDSARRPLASPLTRRRSSGRCSATQLPPATSAC